MASRSFTFDAVQRRYARGELWSTLLRWLGGSNGYHVLRFLVAAILLAAAILKAYALWVADRDSYSSFHIPVWVVEQSVLVEFLLGVWLLVGAFPYAAWLCSTIFFATVLCIALIGGFAGATACSCFGFLATSPWLVALMDVAVLGALVAFRPERQSEHHSIVEAGSSRPLLRAMFLFFAISMTSLIFAVGIISTVSGHRR